MAHRIHTTHTPELEPDYRSCIGQVKCRQVLALIGTIHPYVSAAGAVVDVLGDRLLSGISRASTVRRVSRAQNFAIELVLLLIGVDLRAELKQKLRLPASRVVEDCAGFVQHSKRRIKRVDRIVI